MTTALIRGKTLDEAIELVRDAAIGLLQDGRKIGVWTETGNHSVLVGIARPDAAATMLIPKEEYDGIKFLEMIYKDVGHGQCDPCQG